MKNIFIAFLLAFTVMTVGAVTSAHAGDRGWGIDPNGFCGGDAGGAMDPNGSCF